MGALLDSFRAAGIAFNALPGGRLHATGPLDDATRTTIREHKVAILAELTAANDAATPEQAAELRNLIAIVAANWHPAEHAEALAVAFADPEAALVCFRSLATDLPNHRAR